MTDATKWKELASNTARWMKEIGAVHDDQHHERSYVTSSDWAEQFGMIYDVHETDIGTVVQHAHEMGLWIGFEPFKGWYLSEQPSDAATVVTRLINYLTSLADTVGKYMDAQHESGQMEHILQGYQGRLRVVEIDGVVPLLDAAGKQVADGIRTKLIEARSQFQQPETNDNETELGRDDDLDTL